MVQESQSKSQAFSFEEKITAHHGTENHLRTNSLTQRSLDKMVNILQTKSSLLFSWKKSVVLVDYYSIEACPWITLSQY